MTTIFHVDMDAFFASVEERSNPQLKGKAVAVCGDLTRRTVVAAASYPARKYGLKAGISYAKAKRLCPQAVFVEGNPAKYLDTARRLAEIAREFTDRVEIFSIDEVFLDVTDCPGIEDPAGLAHRFKAAIVDGLELTCSVGVSQNRFLAKMASGMQKPDGLTVLWRADVERMLFPLPVEKLWGVGERTATELGKLGIETVAQLAAFPREILRSRFGIIGEGLKALANGLDCTDLVTDEEAKSMGHEYTFDRDTADVSEIEEMVLNLATKVGRRLRAAEVAGRTVTIKVRFSNYEAISRSHTMPIPTDIDGVIFEEAMRLWGILDYRDSIRLIGVNVSRLSPVASGWQEDLFPNRYGTRHRRALFAADAVRNRYGEDAVFWGRLVRRRYRTPGPVVPASLRNPAAQPR